MSDNDKLTRADRESLLKIARARERVTKSGLVEAGAKLLVDFDQQLDSAYAFDADPVWKEAAQDATKAVEEAQAKVHERCRALGIPDRFAPQILHAWISQGEQAVAKRRAELRGIARRQVDALIKEGKHRTERMSLDVQTQILQCGLTDQAQAFLDSMPSAEELMPKLVLGDLEQMLGKGEGYHQRHLEDRDE